MKFKIPLFIILFLFQNYFVNANEINVFSSRHYESDFQLYKNFTKEHGIKVNIVSGNAKLLEKRILEEGFDCIGDVLILADAGRLGSSESKGIFQSISSKILDDKIPPNFRTKHWFAISKRFRIIFYNPEVVDIDELASLDYIDLSDKKWNKSLLIRSSNNVYNQSMVAHIIENHGEKKAKEWVKGIVRNMYRSPQGNDRAQILGVAAKEGKLAIANTYYYSLMLSGKKGEEQKIAAKKVLPFFPGQKSDGSHINVSGAGILKHSPNKQNAIKFLEFLLSDEAQKHMVDNTFEYPIIDTVDPHPLVELMGKDFKESNNFKLSNYFKWQSKAYKLMLESGWQ